MSVTFYLNSHLPIGYGEKYYRESFLAILSLQSLEKITLDTSDWQDYDLENAIDSLPADLKLENIKELVVSCRATFLLEHCPNATTLCIECASGGACPFLLQPSYRVEHLAVLTPFSGENPLLDSIAAAYPNVRHLKYRVYMRLYAFETFTDPRVKNRLVGLFGALGSMESQVWSERLGWESKGVVVVVEMGSRREVWGSWR